MRERDKEVSCANPLHFNQVLIFTFQGQNHFTGAKRATMPANISISEAKQSDLPDMVAILCDATEPDILTRFLFDHRRAESARKQTESNMASLGKRFTHPTNKCYIIKAVDT